MSELQYLFFQFIVLSKSMTMWDMQMLFTYRPRIPIPVVCPLLCLSYSSTRTLLSLTSTHSIIYLEKPFALHYPPYPANKSIDICGCMATGKNRKNHWVRSPPNTDIWTKSEDIVTVPKRSKRPASWVL